MVYRVAEAVEGELPPVPVSLSSENGGADGRAQPTDNYSSNCQQRSGNDPMSSYLALVYAQNT